MRRLLRRRNTRRWRQPRRRRRRVATGRRRRQRWRKRRRRRRRRRRRQRHRRVRVGEGACGVGAVATARGRRAVRARRRHWRRWRRWRRRRRRWEWWWRRRGGRLAGALAVDHILDVHEAALVRVLVHRRRRRRHEDVRAIWARGHFHHLSALEESAAVDLGAVQRAALAVDLHAVGRRADHVLVITVIVGVVDLHCQVALPLHRRR